MFLLAVGQFRQQAAELLRGMENVCAALFVDQRGQRNHFPLLSAPQIVQRTTITATSLEAYAQWNVACNKETNVHLPIPLSMSDSTLPHSQVFSTSVSNPAWILVW